MPRNVTILNGINGTSEFSEHRKAKLERFWCSIPPFRFRSACFPSGRAPSHPSRRPAENNRFLREQFRAIPGRTRRRRSPVRGSSADEILGDPRRRVHPGHFADERAIGDPRDTVASSTYSPNRSPSQSGYAGIPMKFATIRAKIHLTLLRMTVPRERPNNNVVDPR